MNFLKLLIRLPAKKSSIQKGSTIDVSISNSSIELSLLVLLVVWYPSRLTPTVSCQALAKDEAEPPDNY